MNTLYLIRHGLTRANEQRLYCGWTDLPLSTAGRDLASELKDERPFPKCDLYATSGMQRTGETLSLLLGDVPFDVLPDLREMNFGAFEMYSYDQLRSNPDYIRWIEDEAGDIACPNGESRNAFHHRVTRCANDLMNNIEESSMLIVCHGGVIANLMQAWFPNAELNFYQWQPSACRGYKIQIEGKVATHFEAL